MEPTISIVTGKQGRTNANKPPHELLTEMKTIALDVETLGDDDILRISSNVLTLARDHQGHRFDASYMEEHGGAYGIAVIALDTQLNAREYTMPVFRPTSHGGHVAFRTQKEIENVVKITHDDVPIETAGAMELGLHVAKFRNIECILIVPDTLEHPKLFRALDLEVKGDGTDTTTLVYLRLCDKLGLGRSPPHLSTGKFKFLFPGMAIDTSQVKPRTTKKRAADDENAGTTSGTKRMKREESTDARKTYEILNEMLDDAMRVSDAAKGALYQIAKHFLLAFDGHFGEEKFTETFKSFKHLPGSVLLDMFGNLDMVESITSTTVRDQSECDTILRSVHDMHYIAHLHDD
jgi:hypothetical protein